jgi:four helix bundle protein
LKEIEMSAERLTPEKLKARTKRFSLRVIALTEALPRTRTADVVGRQLLRSGTSVAANYRAACRARSRAEFVARMGIVEEEADESALWIELLIEAKVMPGKRLAALLDQAGQLTAIAVASTRSARPRSRSSQSSIRNSKSQSAIHNPHSTIHNPQSAIHNPQSRGLA